MTLKAFVKNTVAGLLSLFVVAAVEAQSGVPSSVASVKSVGYWKTDSGEGTYRVVVINQGCEHVTTRVLIEWIRRSTSRERDVEVISSVEPSPPFGNGIASLRATLGPPAATVELKRLVS
jgi:hypothetical protein